MIQLYKENNKDYDKAGDIVLNCISCFFKANIDYSWSLELEYPVDDLGIWKFIKENTVIRFPTPTRKDDLFRIYEVNKTENTITAYARPLPRDLEKKVILDKNIVGKNGQESINRILENVDFTGHSNIKDTANIRLVKKTVYSSLLGKEDNTFISRFGGEIYTNKKDIWINDKIGSDTKNLYMTYGVNLKSIEAINNFEGVYTRLYPEIYNGHQFDCVDSELIDMYTDVLEGFVKFDDIKLYEDANEEEKKNNEYYTEEEAKAEVIKRCKALFEDGLDTPNRTYNIEIANLDNLDLYKEYKFITKIDLGDSITVRDKVLDVDVTARCISFTWDCIKEEYTELSLGTAETNIFDSVTDASGYIENILTSNNTISGGAIEGVINALNVQLKAQYNIAEHQHVRAMLFEDLDEESPTFGALCIGTKGLEISNKRNAQDTDWEWGTFITAGIVSADFIRTGLLSNMDSSFVMDLGSDKGLEFFIDNKKSMIIDKSELIFYDNEGKKRIGGLLSGYRTSDATKKYMMLGHRDNSLLGINYYNPNDGQWYNYIKFDKYDQEQDYGYPISFYEDTDFFSNVCHYNPLEMRKGINFTKYEDGTQVGTIYQSSTNDIVVACDVGNVLRLCYKKDGQYYNAITVRESGAEYYGYHKYFYDSVEMGRIFGASNNNMFVACNYNTNLCLGYEKDGSYYTSLKIHRDDNANGGSFVDLYGVTTIYSDLTVKGTKNRAVDTKNYGTRLLNAVESADAIFTDIGETTIGENGEIKVEIDKIFLETIETVTQKYQVFLTLYGDGKAYVSERNVDHFIIKGTSGLSVGYEIKAKQIDYTTTRLEEFKENSSTDIVAVADNKENIIETIKEGELND